jgi:tetratricopeptide (TPR) repeat protein
MRAGVAFALLSAAAPAQEHGVAPGAALFSVDAATQRISADRTAVAAGAALTELAKAMGWRIAFQPESLLGELEHTSLDLSFDDQGARAIAQLIAVAGGADVQFDDRTEDGKFSTALHVVRPPSAEIEAGRARLLARAMQWYRTFLAEDLRFDPLVEEHASKVRMHLGEMLMEAGDLESAIGTFRALRDGDRTHPYVPLALLKTAECQFRMKRLADAEENARQVSRMHPGRPETAQATVLLGRILLAAARYDECAREMRASFLPLAGTPEIIDVFLIAAQAHWHRDRPDQVLRETELMAAAHNFRELDEQQWLSYHFLRGIGAEGTGQHLEAIEALELFLGTGQNDPRRAIAFVVLGRAYAELGKFLEARAAALEALELKGGLDNDWRQRARILEAKTALALGDKDRAFADLEVEVRKQPEQMPELVLFLADAFIEVGRFQKAIATADLLAGGSGAWADRARHRKVVAMWRQASRSGDPQGFPAAAIEIARQIGDPELQRGVAEMIGQAYEALGMKEKAADAYRGLLR